MNNETYPVAIVGGGPVGLAAAAHLTKRGESFVLFEAGDSVGANILEWQHIRLFSPWRYNIDKAAAALLKQDGWQAPRLDDLPTGGEFVTQYLQPLANLPVLKPHIHLGTRVIAVGRKGLDKAKTAGREQRPFVLTIEQGGQRQIVEARAVIDASGTWNTPNPVGSGGIPAQGEYLVQDHIYYGIPDVLGQARDTYAGKHVIVVGSGHSAINTLLDLVRLKGEYPTTQIGWILRKEQLATVYGGQEADALPARGALGSRMRAVVAANDVQVYTPFHIHRIDVTGGQLQISGTMQGRESTIAGVDEIVATTGARPDLSFLREVRVNLDPALESVAELAPLIDPNIHSCGTVRPHGEKELRQPEQDFYLVGMKSYGRAPTFLMATGYEQVRSVMAALTDDWEAAAQVELDLPETGVCSSDFATNTESTPVEAACCGSAEPILEALAV